MFDTFQTNRMERELWANYQKMGKKRYVFFHTVVFGNAIFVLFRGAIYLFTLYVHPFDSTGKVVVASVGILLSFWVGYRIGLLFWRRGVRITSATGETE